MKCFQLKIEARNTDAATEAIGRLSQIAWDPRGAGFPAWHEYNLKKVLTTRSLSAAATGCLAGSFD
jgi:hypothetical protein